MLLCVGFYKMSISAHQCCVLENLTWNLYFKQGRKLWLFNKSACDVSKSPSFYFWKEKELAICAHKPIRKLFTGVIQRVARCWPWERLQLYFLDLEVAFTIYTVLSNANILQWQMSAIKTSSPPRINRNPAEPGLWSMQLLLTAYLWDSL